MADDSFSRGASGGPTRIRKKSTYRESDTEHRTDGHIDALEAERVFEKTLTEWGFPSVSKDSEIEPFLDKIAHVLIKGTSAERNYAEVGFRHDGVWCMLNVLRSHVLTACPTENPIRVWVRSYRNAEVAIRMYEILGNAVNTVQRQSSALSYGCSLDVVHVSFDCADAIVGQPGIEISQLERSVIIRNTAHKARASRSAFLGGNDGGSIQDSASHAAAVDSGLLRTSNVPTVQAPTRTRANFAAMG